MDENKEAFNVFSLVFDQHIIGGNGVPVGLRITPIFKVMDLLEVKNKLRCLERVKMAYGKVVMEEIVK